LVGYFLIKCNYIQTSVAKEPQIILRAATMLYFILFVFLVLARPFFLGYVAQIKYDLLICSSLIRVFTLLAVCTAK